MPREASKTFTDKELEIMRVIWERGEATAREIQEALPGERHYNSVLTIIRVLERKGHLTHRAEGKAHIYRAKAKPEKAQRRVISHLIEQLFGGSAAAMILHLVETGDLTEEDLKEVREQIAARSRAGKAGKQPKKPEKED
ncbi:MAG TPA: BlaI/MecI/CopY family transcriptional regulator [Blastocatellia bacterium]|nr:BlaI/MecI/CopY family transcriptional regulator [Blastocatellia bacterium]